jgi:hypothetical protein
MLDDFRLICYPFLVCRVFYKLYYIAPIYLVAAFRFKCIYKAMNDSKHF